MKVCTKCKQSKTHAEFHLDSSKLDGLYSSCKECHRKHKSNHKKIDRKIDPSKYKARKLKERYGISLEDYNNLLEKQEHKCIICEKHESEFGVSLAVDHCHKTGIVRGLLCFKCNTRVGHVETNPKEFSRIFQYLISHEVIQ